MFFSPFLALRYLKPKRTFVSIITLISIIGVTIGVWKFTIVIAVFSGYGERIKENILGFEPHLEVRAGGYIDDFVPLLQKLDEIDEVVSATPYVLGSVIMEYEGMRSAPVIKAILPPEEGSKELERFTAKLAKEKNPLYDPKKAPEEPEYHIKGEFYLDPYTAVIGDAMAKNLDIHIGSKLLLYSPKDMASVLEALDRVEKEEDESNRKKASEEVKRLTVPQEVTVSGIFDSGNYDVDSNFIYLHLETGQILYNFDLEESHGIAIRTDDAFKANHYKDQLLVKLGMGQMRKADFKPAAVASQRTFTPVRLIVLLLPFLILGPLGYFCFRRSFVRVMVILLSIVIVILGFFWFNYYSHAKSNLYFVEQLGGQPYRLMTWMQIHKLIFDAIAAERQVMYLILFGVVVLGGFCITNTMITVTSQKRSEIGLMKALGARESQICWLFVFQGMFVGAIGVIVGILLGLYTLHVRNEIADFLGQQFGVDLFASEIYRVDGGLPAVLRVKDVLFISSLSFVGCTIAALIPALIAAYTQPAKALRSD